MQQNNLQLYPTLSAYLYTNWSYAGSSSFAEVPPPGEPGTGSLVPAPAVPVSRISPKWGKMAKKPEKGHFRRFPGETPFLVKKGQKRAFFPIFGKSGIPGPRGPSPLGRPWDGRTSGAELRSD